MRLQLKVLISAEDIARRVQELGREITADYQGRSLMIIGILKGAVVFMSDLIRQISVPLEVDFMAISSYGEATETSGVVQLLKIWTVPLKANMCSSWKILSTRASPSLTSTSCCNRAILPL